MNKGAELLRKARSEKGWTQARLSQVSGVSQQMISKLERGDTALSASAELYPLSKALGLAIECFLDEAARPIVACNTADAPPDEWVAIRASSVRFGNENGRVTMACGIDETSEPRMYSRSWFVRERLILQQCMGIIVSDDSMEPTLFPGDWILVNRDESKVSGGGHIYAFRYSDQLCVKRLFSRLSGALVLRSMNPACVDEEVSPEDVERHITIIGRVRDRRGGGGL